MIGDCHTAALVSKTGSIDWLCFPYFDSAACFAALLGTAENGHWSISPAEPIRKISRRYREGTLILETEFETDSGSVVLIDCMTPGDDVPNLLRLVVGKRGDVPMKSELVIRFDYGSVVPWVRRTDAGISAGYTFGSAEHHEIARWVQFGLTPSQAIVAATERPAQLLGIADLGTLQVGKSADFVVLNANPLENIRNTRQIASVYLRGAMLDRDSLLAGWKNARASR